MTKLHAHFDGRVLIPDEPVDLPQDCTLEVHVQALNRATQNFGAPDKLPTFSVPPGAPIVRSEDIRNVEDEY
jgi:hypothetical protein